MILTIFSIFATIAGCATPPSCQCPPPLLEKELLTVAKCEVTPNSHESPTPKQDEDALTTTEDNSTVETVVELGQDSTLLAAAVGSDASAESIDEGIDDEPDLNEAGPLPKGVSSKDMDRFGDADWRHRREDVPDHERIAIKLPILAAITPSHPFWKEEIAPRIGNSPTSEVDRAMITHFLSESEGANTIVVKPDEKIEVFNNARLVAQRPLSLDFKAQPLLTLWPHIVFAANLVDDPEKELVVIGIDAEGGDTIYYDVYKAFGGKIGRIFRTEVGFIADKKIMKTAHIDYVTGKSSVGLSRTPIDQNGQLVTAQRVIYDYNYWAGNYMENQPPERERLGPPSWIEAKKIEQPESVPDEDLDDEEEEDEEEE